MIKAIFLDPPVKGGQKLKRYLNRVGLKWGDFSWFVEESKLPHAMLIKADGSASVVRVDGRCTLKSLRRAQERARKDLDI